MNERKTRFEVTLADKSVGISVREWRIGRSKGQVICLHGLGVSGAEYAPMAMGLNEAGFDVLAPDWIGHGDSDYLGDPEAYDWTSYIKCLAAIVRHYPEPATHYVGTSWGGAILLIYLLSQRLRPGSATFVDVPIQSGDEIAQHGNVIAAQARETFSSIAEGNAFLAKLRPFMMRRPEAFTSFLDRERYRAKGDRFMFSFDPAIVPKFLESAQARYNHFMALRRLSFDMLFAYGASSPHRWPASYVASAEKSPLITYNGDMKGGHPPMLLFEEQFRGIVEFIKAKNMASRPMLRNPGHR